MRKNNPLYKGYGAKEMARRFAQEYDISPDEAMAYAEHIKYMQGQEPDICAL